MPFVSASSGDTKGLRIPEVQNAMGSGESRASWVTPELVQHLTKNPTLAKGIKDPMLIKAIQEFSVNPREALKKYQNDEKVLKFLQAFMQQTAGFNDALKGLKEQKGYNNKNESSSKKNNIKENTKKTMPKVVPLDELDEAQHKNKKITKQNKAILNKSAPISRPVDRGDSLEFSTSDGSGRSVSKHTLQDWMSNPYIRQALEKPATSMMIQHLRTDPSAFGRYRGNKDLEILIRAGIIIVPASYMVGSAHIEK